nr:hypothetical protein [Sphaerisporangium perillae]
MVEPHAHLDKAFTAARVDNPDGSLRGAIGAWLAARALLRAALLAGADLVGGAPALDDDPAGAVEALADAGAGAGVGLDLHIDETLDPDVLDAHRTPAHIHQVWGRLYITRLPTLISRVYRPISLARPVPSGSTDTSELCQGCSHPARAPPRIRLPSASAGRCDGPPSEVFHPRSENKRLTAHMIVIVPLKLGEHPAQMPLTIDQHVVQALTP